MSLLKRLKALKLARRADRLRLAMRSSSAVAAAEQACRLAPDDPRLRIRLALAASANDQPQRAAEEAHVATRTSPRNAAAWLTLCTVLFDSENYEEAGSAAEMALRVSPENDLARGYCSLIKWIRRGARPSDFGLDPNSLPESPRFLARLLVTVEERTSKVAKAAQERSRAHVQTKGQPLVRLLRKHDIRKRGLRDLLGATVIFDAHQGEAGNG